MYTDCETQWQFILRRELNWEVISKLIDGMGVSAALARIDYDRETDMLLKDERWKQPYNTGESKDDQDTTV